jgi:hypothetical protein
VSYRRDLLLARAMRGEKAAIADYERAKRDPRPGPSLQTPGVALRWAHVRARIRTEHPTWADEWVDDEAANAVNRVGLHVLASPGAGLAPRASFPCHRMHDHVMVGLPYEPESPQTRWRRTRRTRGG